MRAPGLSLPPEPQHIAVVLKTSKASAPEPPCPTASFTVPSFTTSRNSRRTARPTNAPSKPWAPCLPVLLGLSLSHRGHPDLLRLVSLSPKTMWRRRIPHFLGLRNRRPCR